MDDEKKFRDDHLPVTAEIGGEGGSYADPTYQESATKPDGLGRAAENDEPNAAADVAQYAEHQEQIANGGVGTDPGPAEGMKKYPTE